MAIFSLKYKLIMVTLFILVSFGCCLPWKLLFTPKHYYDPVYSGFITPTEPVIAEINHRYAGVYRVSLIMRKMEYRQNFPPEAGLLFIEIKVDGQVLPAIPFTGTSAWTAQYGYLHLGEYVVNHDIESKKMEMRILRDQGEYVEKNGNPEIIIKADSLE